MRVFGHRWLLNHTKNTGQQFTSSANTLRFRPSLITLFEAEQAVQMYIWWTEALAKAGCHMTKFSNIFGKFITEIKCRII